jgi:hypothetical protein
MSSTTNQIPSTRKSVTQSSWLSRFLRDDRGLTTMEILAITAGLIVMVTMAAPILQDGAKSGAGGVVQKLTDWTGGGK